MALTAVVFLMVYFAGLILALVRHPIFGLYAYLFAFYAHPPSRWWQSDVPGLRWSLIAAVVTLIATFRLGPLPEGQRWWSAPAAKLLTLYAVWMGIQFAWAVTGNYHVEGTVLFTKYAILFFLMYRLLDSTERIKDFCLINVLGCLYLGWIAWTSYETGRLESVGGPGIDTSNALGMHMTTGLAMAAALLLVEGWRYRIGAFLAIPFIIDTIVLTRSRGAFLAMLGAGLAAFIFKPPGRRLLFMAIGSLALVLFLMLTPDLFFERMQSITTVTQPLAGEEDEDVEGAMETRVELIKAQWQMFKDHPFGAGHLGTNVLSADYLEERYLSHMADGRPARSSHNAIMAVLVDQGIVGILLYGALLLWMLLTLLKLRRLDKDGLPYDLAVLRMGFAAALCSFLVAGLFSNHLKAEVQIWLIALLSRLHWLAIQQNVQKPATVRGEGPRRASRPGPVADRRGSLLVSKD